MCVFFNYMVSGLSQLYRHIQVNRLNGRYAFANHAPKAYSPQLGSKLGISHTQLNIVALSGNRQ